MALRGARGFTYFGILCRTIIPIGNERSGRQYLPIAKKEEQWSIETLHANSARFKKLAKRYAGEFDSCMNNLNKIQVLLRQEQKNRKF